MLTANDVLTRARIMPVLTIDRLEDAVPMSEALMNGGLSAVEITLRTDIAFAAIEAVAKALPDLAVGVGTITKPDDLKRSVDAGATFAISPGQSQPLLDAGNALPIPFIPAVANASDVLACLASGYETVKFFPAEAAGGIPAIKSLAGPFPQLRFCPTGGINAEKAPAYLAVPSILCVGGSWMLSSQAVKDRDWAAVTAAAKAAVEAAA